MSGRWLGRAVYLAVIVAVTAALTFMLTVLVTPYRHIAGDGDVYGEADLNWTVLAYTKPIVLTDCVGNGVLTLVPFQDWSILPTLFGKFRGRITSIGVAGTLPAEQVALFEADGVSRICAVGEMQTPPLDWSNGGFDLLKELDAL